MNAMIVVAPEPGGNVTSAHTTYDSIRGLIETEWQLNGDWLDMKVQIPANTTATIVVPATSQDDVWENERSLADSDDVQFIKQEPGRIFLAVGSGQYEFRIQHPVIAGDLAAIRGDGSCSSAIAHA